MTLQDHCNLLQRSITSPFPDTVDRHFYLPGSSHHPVEGVGRSHSQIIVAMSGDDGLVDTVHMLLQVLDLLKILLRQTIARGIRDIHHRRSCLDNSLHDTGEVFIVCTAGILTVELHIVNKTLGILSGSHSTFEYFISRGVKLIHDVLITRSDTGMDALVLGILQGVESHINISFNSTRQSTDDWPRNCF